MRSVLPQSQVQAIKAAAAIYVPRAVATQSAEVRISLEYEGNRIVLPINPENLKVTRPSQAHTVEVIGIGEVSVPIYPKLATIDIVSFFWEQRLKEGAAGQYTYRTSKEYADWFKLWQRVGYKAPARWVVESGGFVAAPNLLGPIWVTCEHFNYEIRAGEESDVYYELRLKEYRPFGAKTINFASPPSN